MTVFTDAREAKEFVVARIVEEAQRQGSPLSEVEREMLYFSETGWTLPDIDAVNDEFERTVDQRAYEKRIADLVRAACERARDDEQELRRWREASTALSREDHYISVMLPTVDATVRPRWDRLKLVATALLSVAALLGLMYVADRFRLL